MGGMEFGSRGDGKQRSFVGEAHFPLWRLALIALPQLSVQVLWCFIGPNSAPYMRHLGAGDALATLNNIAGPITGFFTGPLVGAASDSCTSRFGRRRPVILAGLLSLWVAGMLFASSEHIFSRDKAIFFAAPMYWVMDITINILQTPHRALVSDLAAEHQQIPMQVVFVFMMSIGNFIGFSVMQIYDNVLDHMLELMLGICALNTVCVAIQFMAARETPLKKDKSAGRRNACAPIYNVTQAVYDSPTLLYQLAGVHCLVWIGITAWTVYAKLWMQVVVFEGNLNPDLPPSDPGRLALEEGERAFSVAGQAKSALQLLSTLAIIALLLKSKIPPRLLYAPCIFVGCAVSFMAAFFVGHSGLFAQICVALSVMPETGSFAIPFGLVATLNKRAAQEGKHVSTALQMSLLNCCVTIGQQICTLTLAVMQGGILSFSNSLMAMFVIAGVAQLIGGTGALFLDDDPGADEVATPSSSSSDEESDGGF